MTAAYPRSIARCLATQAITAWLLAVGGTHAATAHPSPAVPVARAAPVASMAGCMMSFDQATVDYGSFTAGQLVLDANRRYLLSPRTVSLTISCPTARPIALRLKAPARHDGAAKFAGTGALQIVLGQVRVDGDETRIVNPDAPHGPQPQLAMRPGDTVELENGRAGRSVTAQIALQPEVGDADVRVSDQTEWSATLQFELLDL